VGRGTAQLSYTGQLLQVGLIWEKVIHGLYRGILFWHANLPTCMLHAHGPHTSKLSLHDKKLIKKELKKTCCTIIHIAFLHITAKLSIGIIVINPERATADCYVVRREEVFRFV
jgi:hypothetical protein